MVAEPNTILRGLVGSSVHGLVLDGTDDRDEIGVCVEPRRYVVGFGKFEQWVYRSAAEREGRARARSRAGDLDLTIYSLRKWARLALQGNPTVLLLLYLPDDALVIRRVGRQRASRFGAISLTSDGGAAILRTSSPSARSWSCGSAPCWTRHCFHQSQKPIGSSPSSWMRTLRRGLPRQHSQPPAATRRLEARGRAPTRRSMSTVGP